MTIRLRHLHTASFKGTDGVWHMVKLPAQSWLKLEWLYGIDFPVQDAFADVVSAPGQDTAALTDKLVQRIGERFSQALNTQYDLVNDNTPHPGRPYVRPSNAPNPVFYFPIIVSVPQVFGGKFIPRARQFDDAQMHQFLHDILVARLQTR
ncbi:MAG: hypothetical protein J0L77_00995 [Alphaproteobacteria bacterium]|nr:hypothetical protein [Alphaproteobacteria bacterium]